MRPRQPYAVIARFRNGGPMRHRNAARGGARNEQAELLEELGSDWDPVPTGEDMRRFKIKATFYVQAQDAAEANEVATDMLTDMVSEQYEHVDEVLVVEEAEQTEFHRKQNEDDSYDEDDKEDEE